MSKRKAQHHPGPTRTELYKAVWPSKSSLNCVHILHSTVLARVYRCAIDLSSAKACTIALESDSDTSPLLPDNTSGNQELIEPRVPSRVQATRQ